MNEDILERNTPAFWKDQPHRSCDMDPKHHLAFQMLHYLQTCRFNRLLSFTNSFSLSWSEFFSFFATVAHLILVRFTAVGETTVA